MFLFDIALALLAGTLLARRSAMSPVPNGVLFGLAGIAAPGLLLAGRWPLWHLPWAPSLGAEWVGAAVLLATPVAGGIGHWLGKQVRRGPLVATILVSLAMWTTGPAMLDWPPDGGWPPPWFAGVLVALSAWTGGVFIAIHRRTQSLPTG